MRRAEFVEVSLSASPALGLALLAVHSAAIASVLALPVAWWTRIGACLLLIVNGLATIRVHGFRKGSRACTRMRLNTEGDCELRSGNQRNVSGVLLPGWVALPLLIVLRVRCAGERLPRAIVLLPDGASADSLRRLRIFLRFGVRASFGRQ